MYLDWEILSINSFSICISIIIDYISFIFIGFVFLISSIVIFYRYSYIYDDLYKNRFLFLVILFIISIMFMIISPNIISILLGWDGLGLVSYALVIFFQNNNSYNSGILTVLTNRIGDVAILMCIVWIINFGRWRYIYYLGFYDSYIETIIIFSVLASFTKSAQIPFSSWLPAAIAAPTPVSALVHSSTLVTAGVYLIIRFRPIIYNIDCMLFIILSIMTMFISGLGANFEFDLKKIIALSTLSQLGLIIMILFIGFPKLAFFHLLTHAFFKALLFLCAGLIIHVMNYSQDIRDIGHIIYILPYTSICFIISRISLSGIPFLSGFYSKDLILEVFSIYNINFIYYFIFITSVAFTISYSFRLMNYLIFIGCGIYVFQSYYEDNKIIFSILLLTFFSIFLGSFLMWLIFKTPIFIVLPFYIKIMPLISILSGLLLGLGFIKLDINYHIFNIFNIYFFGLIWFMPTFRTYGLYKYFYNISINYNSLIDLGWGEYLFSISHIKYIYITRSINYTIEYNNIKLFMISFLFLIFMIILYLDSLIFKAKYWRYLYEWDSPNIFIKIRLILSLKMICFL